MSQWKQTGLDWVDLEDGYYGCLIPRYDHDQDDIWNTDIDYIDDLLVLLNLLKIIEYEDINWVSIEIKVPKR